MKKIVIIIISLFLLLSAVNFGTSKPIMNYDLNPKTENTYDNSVIDNVQEQQVLQNINRLDGYFTENQGQVENGSVRYYIQGKGVWFLDGGVVFEIQEPVKQTEVQRDPFDRFHPDLEPEKPAPRKSVVLKLNFEGCNKVIPIGRGLLTHRSNFFYGNNSSKWSTNVPNYQEIIYENLYENIDLRYYSSDKGLKYDFIIYPGGEPSDIRMRYEGAQDVSIESFGELDIRTKFGKIVDTGLFIYQLSKNDETKIDGKFKKLAPSTYGFEITGKYDRNKAITIDPLVYSTYIGGSSRDEGYGIVVDTTGNAYVTGSTESSDFPTTPSANDTTYDGDWDVFVLKLNQTGTSLLYSTFIGGSNSDRGYDIVLDPSGNTYVTGRTESPDFPITPGANDTFLNGFVDVFVLKLNPTGASIIYSTYLGGSGDDQGHCIVLDAGGNTYVTGVTGSSNFPTTLSANDTTHNGNQDVFVLKLNPTGASLLYSTFIGGSGGDWGNGIVLDNSGNTYVTGYTWSSNFPITPGANDTTHNGNQDGFVLKLNPTGTSLLYSTFIGGSSGDWGYGIAVDTAGNAFVTGRTDSSDFPITPGAFNDSITGVFVLKLNPTGASLLYSTFIGGGSGSDIAVDTDDNAYVTGYTWSSNFPTTPDANDTTYNGDPTDGFMFKLNPTGAALLYSTYLGGSSRDEGNGIALDTAGNTYVTGKTESSNFTITPNANDTTYNGNYDVFVLKLGFNTLPSVVDLKISDVIVFRTNSIHLYSNTTDNEDLEQNLIPHFEYRDPNEQVWNNTFFSTPQYNNSRWEVSFTPLKNATLGVYDFRVRFNDTNMAFSNRFYLNDSLLVLNNIPLIEDIALSNNSAILGDSISIWINATDVEEIEENLTIELEYRDLSELSWENTYLSAPTYNNERWECSFNIPFDALFGYYDFRARCNDSDGNYSSWLYLNDSLYIYNIGPKVIDMKLSKSSIYRTESVFLYVNGSDYETPEDMLTFYCQYKPNSEDEWVNLTGNYLNNTWEVGFTTDKESILGYYDFRVKFEDNESISSGWVYQNASLEVLNNPPTISEDLDDLNVGIQPLILDLTPYESDIEDSDEILIWSIEPQTYSYIESIKIINLANDTLKIVPKENVSGNEDIELILMDKDGGTAVKSDITIHVDSTISELTPKVTLLFPPDGGIVNTLTPTLKWKLEYSGTDLITYTVILDENPDPQQELKTGLTTTEYTLETELEDGKIYYWKVIPKNGICLSEPFSFTIDLKFVLLYEVNLKSEKDSIIIKQGESKLINLTVKNEGNTIDNFKIEISSANLQSHISIDKTNVLLDPNIDSILKLSVDIPDDFPIGDFTITVTATSLSDVTAKDEVTINVKVVSKYFVPNYQVSISISPTSLELEQGESDNVTITITNDGNIKDDFNIRFESTDFTSTDIQFSKISLTLNYSDSDQVTVTIKIPEDMEPGEYTIKFIIEGNGVPEESTLTITVTEKDGGKPKDGDEYNTMLYALIGIIVIIIVVLILLFIFFKRKKKPPEESEPIEEERLSEELPLPEKVPSEIPPEQPPTSEVPPDQVPAPETPPTPEQPPQPPEVTPQEPQPQVEPAPLSQEPMPQVEEQPVLTPQVEQQPQVEVQEPVAAEQPEEPLGQAPVPKIKTQPTIKENNV